MTASPRSRSQGRIDWEAVRDRLARTARADEEASRLSPERVRALLERRARELARAPEPLPAAGSTVEIVAFDLAHERYALETRYVHEIVRMTDFAPVPGCPEFLLGITSVRGRFFPVIDLRRFFSIPIQGMTDLSRLILVGEKEPEIGILADAIQAVRLLGREAILPPPPSVTGIGRDYLLGVTGEALILLDGDTLLRDPRLFIDAGQEPDHKT